MMGTSDSQPSMFHHINLEQFVTAEHPKRRIQPLIGINRIRTLCEPLYSEVGRPSIQPKQLFLAAPRQCQLGITSEPALVRGLTGNLVLRWFTGLDLDTDPWDHPTFSQNRKRRFTESGLLEQWFDETLAVKQKLVSMHTTLDGTLLPANASQKNFVPIEVFRIRWTTRNGSGHWINRRTKTPAIRRSHFERSAARIRRMCRRPIPTRNWPTSGMGRSRWGRHRQ